MKHYKKLQKLSILLIFICFLFQSSFLLETQGSNKAGTLAFHPQSHDFGDVGEEEINTTTFQIWREGGCCSIEYYLETDYDWIEIFPTSGTSHGERDTITVTIDANKLSIGQQMGNVTIQSNNGGGELMVECRVVRTNWPDLYCSGNLTWKKIEPGAKVKAAIQVLNIGDPRSKLDWELISYPGWGEWNFSLIEGYQYTPEDPVQVINVSVVVPDERLTNFTGTITIVNKQNESDVCDINVYLSTHKQKKDPLMYDLFLQQRKNMYSFIQDFFYSIQYA